MTATLRPAALALLAALALAGCTNTETLQPTKQEAATAAASAAPAAAGAADGATAAIPRITALQLAPIVGISVEAAAPLSERLVQRAKERGISMARAQAPASHVLKGYFSALAEGKETTVVYVWDLLDSEGNRLHRTQGQEKVPGGGGWSSVKAATMQTIADRTIEDIGQWLAGASG
ncbi:MAG: hypothetical protein J0H34_19410 [Rhizobiales bacterium]|nr:hypothetical protein [Hyphomicrobiales bacterium]